MELKALKIKFEDNRDGLSVEENLRMDLFLFGASFYETDSSGVKKRIHPMNVIIKKQNGTKRK